MEEIITERRPPEFILRTIQFEPKDSGLLYLLTSSRPATEDTAGSPFPAASSCQDSIPSPFLLHRKVNGALIPPSQIPRPSEKYTRELRVSEGNGNSSSKNEKDKGVSVQVILRCRPLSEEEQSLGMPTVISILGLNFLSELNLINCAEVSAAREKNGIYIPRDHFQQEEAQKKVGLENDLRPAINRASRAL